jgi:hypothetical protein
MKAAAAALVRLYPRAWRERYGDEFQALLDARAVTWRVVVDVARGCVREHVARIAGRPSPLVRMSVKHLMRIPAAIVLAIVIARTAWDLTNFLDARGWIASPDHLTYHSLLAGSILMVRAMVGWFAALTGQTRWTIRRPELGAWIAVAFLSVMFERWDQIYLQSLPWNANSDFWRTWRDSALGLFAPLTWLLCGTRASAANVAVINALRKRRPDVPTSILGLNR